MADPGIALFPFDLIEWVVAGGREVTLDGESLPLSSGRKLGW